MSSTDAAQLGLVTGGAARLVTSRGAAVVTVEVSAMMQAGHVSLPNGMGLDEDQAGGTQRFGVAPNELTSNLDRDSIAGTPWHKSVPARVEAVAVQ